MKLDGRDTANQSLVFDAATVAYKGAREAQEDSILTNFPVGQGFGYGIISDGMGGHEAGQIASAIVATEMYSHLKIREGDLEGGMLNVPMVLREAASNANRSVAKFVETEPDAKGMGATLLMPLIRDNKLFWISIGDSPLLLFRNGALRQLNEDHSLGPQIDFMVKSGSMDAEQGKNHPSRNLLASAINGTEIEKIDCPTSSIKLKPGDIIIGASDGLQFLSDSAIANTLMRNADKPAYKIARALLNEIEYLNHQDQDNMSLLVVKLEVPIEEVSLDVDDLPVLARAGNERTQPQTPIAAAPEPAPQPAAPKAEPPAAKETAGDSDEGRKFYYYRGQKYYKDA